MESLKEILSLLAMSRKNNAATCWAVSLGLYWREHKRRKCHETYEERGRRGGWRNRPAQAVEAPDFRTLGCPVPRRV